MAKQRTVFYRCRSPRARLASGSLPAHKRPMKRVCSFLLICLALLWTAACGTAKPATYETVAPATLSPGGPIPVPTAEGILTLFGAIGVTNAGDTLVFDIATLERLGLVEYTVDDPWENVTVTYRGVLMSDLLKFAEASTSVASVHLVALDGYAVDIPVADIQKWPILLALQANGEYMNIEQGGPTRIVFPYHAYAELSPLTYNGLWIWNITTIEVK